MTQATQVARATPVRGRPNKAALVRIKAATVAVSIAAFLGSLGIVAYANPAIKTAAGSTAQTQLASAPVAATTRLRRTALQLPSRPQQSLVVPLTRTRGS